MLCSSSLFRHHTIRINRRPLKHATKNTKNTEEEEEEVEERQQ